MRIGISVCLAVVALCGGWPSVAFAVAEPGGPVLTDPLVVSGSPTEAEQLQAQEQATLTSPESVVVREESQTKFEALDGEQAAKVANEVFPQLIGEPAGGPPRLPVGQSVTGFVNAYTAQVDLGSDENGLVQSLVPMAIATSATSWSPLDLGLSERAGVFEPRNPLVSVQIPRRAGEGVSAPLSGVSLTPVGGQGAGLTGEEGRVSGATVVFGNTQKDTDTVAKPSTFGFALDTILRSVESPQDLSFVVGLPTGASLTQSADGSIQVVKEGTVIAQVAPIRALDAVGTSVPVSTKLSGDTLNVEVSSHSAEFQYPIEVDPEFNTGIFSDVSKGSWEFNSATGGFAHGELCIGSCYPAIVPSGGYAAGQRAELYYRTNGDSRIYKLDSTVYAIDNEGEIYLEFEGSGGLEGRLSILEAHVLSKLEWHGYPNEGWVADLCARSGCSVETPAEHNSVRLGEITTGPYGPSAKAALTSDDIYISQPKTTHSTVTYNTNAPEIEYTAEGKKIKTPNLAYAGGWVGRHSGGALEYTAKDAGLGVSETALEDNSSGTWQTPTSKNYLGEEAVCKGVQCAPEQHVVVVPSNYNWPNGEFKLRVSARDAIEHTSSSEFGEGERVVKEDSTPPFGIKLTGLPTLGGTLQLGEVEGHVKVEAFDGEASVPSSGIESLSLAVDGHQIGGPAGSCSAPTGSCTASAEWAVNGAELGVGMHTMTVEATDRAGNVETEGFRLEVYHASPIGIGPGSVNPESGNFALDAGDVNLSGGAGVLAVTRHYDSRNPIEGEEGPLGPEWSVSLGELASLEELPDKSVMVVGPEGLTHFNTKVGGGFEAPAGDANLTLELHGSEYLLKNTSKGTTTRFTRPSGAESWMPTVSEGPVTTDTLTDTYRTAEAVNEYPLPSGTSRAITTGPEGDLWFTNLSTNKVGKITKTGVLRELGSLPAGSSPEGITTGPDGNLWVADWNSGKVSRMTPSGTVSEYALAAGSEPHAIAAGPDHNLWVTEEGTGKIAKLATWGERTEYTLPTNESRPGGITVGPDGALWFTNWVNKGGLSKIGRITTSGEITEYPLPNGSEPWSITAGPENDLWFTDVLTGKIGKITTFGAVTEYSSGSYFPYSITAGSDGNLWFTDWSSGKSRISKITPTGTVSEYPLPENSDPYAITSGPEGNLWFTDSTNIGMITTAGVVIEPTLELAPHPSASCPVGEPEKWEKGCRGLEFVYAEKTKEHIGESETEWGEYKGRLQEVKFVAFNPATKGITKTTVAKYEYDKVGRLRAETNPETSLKTTYGYDAEGHVTVFMPAGQQPWLFAYGTGEDQSNGRLLTTTRPSASTAAGNGQAPVKITAPALSSTTAAEGFTLSVSNGTWSNTPLSYSYQWVRCGGGEMRTCTPISGATNQSYTPTSNDRLQELYAIVTATNATGSAAAESNISSSIQAALYWKKTSTFGLTGEGNGQFKDPWGIAVGESEDVFVADSGNGRVEKFSSSGGFIKAFGKTGSGANEFSSPEGLAIQESGEGKYLYVADSGNNRIAVASQKLESDQAYGTGKTPAGVTTVRTPHGQYQEKMYVTLHAKSEVERLPMESGYEFRGVEYEVFGKEGTENGQFKGPAGVAANENEDVFIVDEGNDRVEKLTTGDQYISQFGSKGSGNGQFLAPRGVALESNGFTGIDIYVADSGNNRVDELNEAGEYITQFSTGSEPQGIAFGKNKMYVTLGAGNKVEVFEKTTAPNPTPEPPKPGSNAVATVEYQVPVSGTGQAYNMAPSTLETWAEKDFPSAATAIFPPDEPMGWPAKDFKRATVYYMDKQARTINTASPSGAISTQEYNEEDQVTRALSADNRVTALNEGCLTLPNECKSAEVAELLDTKSNYSTEGQLTETLGPQHTVKLVAGKEGKAEETLVRNHVKYHYDEGAPEGGTYNLVTKIEDAAQAANKEEFDKRTSMTGYSGQSNLGWKLREPTSATTDPGGLNLTTTTRYEEPKEGQESTGNVVETRSTAANGGDKAVPPAFVAQFGKLGSEPGQLKEPVTAVITSTANVNVLDSGNNRIEEFTAAGTYNNVTFGSWGTGNGQFKSPKSMVEDSKGNLWVADTGNNRVQELNSKDEYHAQFGKEGTAEDQFKEPKAIAVTAGGSIFVADTGNNRIEKFNEEGVFQLAFGWGVSNGEAKLQVCTSSCKAGIAGSGTGQFSTPRGIAVSAGKVWVADTGNSRLEGFNESGENPTVVGSHGSGNGQFAEPKAIIVESASGNLWVSDSANDRLQELSSTGAYITSIGIKGTGSGQFEEPWGTAITPGGNLYIADTKNARIQRWVPTITGNAQAHDVKTIYYTAKGEAEAIACQNHAEWAGLPCRTEPVAQPAVAGAPELPVTTISYNIWDQPETIKETFTEKVGETLRTITREKKTSYDSAGRPISSKETVTPATDKSLPETTDKYNAINGSLEEQSTTGEEPKATTVKYNKLGQLESYVDADGNITTFEYEKEKDARLIKVTDSKGNQTYHYNSTTGFLTELTDAGMGTIKAEYDLAGKLTNETYPNAMKATYTHNQVGETTSVEYKKTAHCAITCPEIWYSDTVTPSVHGETLKQVSTLSEEPNYTYNAAGWLLQTQEVPVGEGCKTRIYAYDEESNRISETTREPGSEGKCASEGGSTEWHTYQTANSMTDPGVTYDPFGNTTKLPAADAGGSELTSEYYIDGQVFKQEQNGQKIEYKLDPAGRTRQTITTGTTNSTATTHYDAAGGAVAWTGEGTGETEKWARDIPGIDGTLTATQTGEGKTAKPTVLLLHDLQGNVVAEAAISEAETKLLKKYNSTEFGVPNSKEAPPKYAWLGATGVTSELPSGVITQDGITYVPQTGRPLQTQGITLPTPENTSTPFTRPVEAWVGSRAGEGAAIGLAKAKQLEEELAAASQPPGEIPMPVPPGGEPSGGGGIGGCSGTHACAASPEGVEGYHEEGNGYLECSVWGSWGSGGFLASEISGWGHWVCEAGYAPGFEMQIAGYAYIEGVWYVLGENTHPITKSWSYSSSGDFEHTWKCPKTGSYYHLWFWGREWGVHNKTQWSASGWERRIGSCTFSGTVDMSPVGQAGEDV